MKHNESKSAMENLFCRLLVLIHNPQPTIVHRRKHSLNEQFKFKSKPVRCYKSWFKSAIRIHEAKRFLKYFSSSFFSFKEKKNGKNNSVIMRINLESRIIDFCVFFVLFLCLRLPIAYRFSIK